MHRKDLARPWIDHWPWLVKRVWPDGRITIVSASKTQEDAQKWADYYTGEAQQGTFFVEKFDPRSPTNVWGGLR